MHKPCIFSVTDAQIRDIYIYIYTPMYDEIYIFIYTPTPTDIEVEYIPKYN